MTIEASGPNTAQIEYWNEVSGPKWVALEAALDEQIAHLGLAAMDRAPVRAGQRVVDVGCGCGQTTLQLAERVGAEGSVLGVDISTPMLERARQRAAALAQVSFRNADAQTEAFGPASFDLVFSRFGVMFFADPTAAFANLRGALAAGGRVAFACWQELKRNPWMLVPMAAAAAHLDFGPPPEPNAPGPFSFADDARVRGILEAAGLRDVTFEPIESEVVVGGRGDLDRAVDFVTQMGPAGRAMREADEASRAKAIAAVREALEPYATPDGVRMAASCWLVTATA